MVAPIIQNIERRFQEKQGVFFLEFIDGVQESRFGFLETLKNHERVGKTGWERTTRGGQFTGFEETVTVAEHPNYETVLFVGTHPGDAGDEDKTVLVSVEVFPKHQVGEKGACIGRNHYFLKTDDTIGVSKDHGLPEFFDGANQEDLSVLEEVQQLLSVVLSFDPARQ